MRSYTDDTAFMAWGNTLGEAEEQSWTLAIIFFFGDFEANVDLWHTAVGYNQSDQPWDSATLLIENSLNDKQYMVECEKPNLPQRSGNPWANKGRTQNISARCRSRLSNHINPLSIPLLDETDEIFVSYFQANLQISGDANFSSISTYCIQMLIISCSTTHSWCDRFVTFKVNVI